VRHATLHTVLNLNLIVVNVKFKMNFSPDKWKHNITVLTDGLDNQVSSILSKSGHAVGHLQSPCGLAVDVETGNIIIADTGNDRVQVIFSCV
jgi:hypothetical protein